MARRKTITLSLKVLSVPNSDTEMRTVSSRNPAGWEHEMGSRQLLAADPRRKSYGFVKPEVVCLLGILQPFCDCWQQWMTNDWRWRRLQLQNRSVERPHCDKIIGTYWKAMVRVSRPEILVIDYVRLHLVLTRVNTYRVIEDRRSKGAPSALLGCLPHISRLHLHIERFP